VFSGQSNRLSFLKSVDSAYEGVTAEDRRDVSLTFLKDLWTLEASVSMNMFFNIFFL
jgi:hypothetical protein